jgi:hypothetical protein
MPKPTNKNQRQKSQDQKPQTFGRAGTRPNGPVQFVDVTSLQLTKFGHLWFLSFFRDSAAAFLHFCILDAFG